MLYFPLSSIKSEVHPIKSTILPMVLPSISWGRKVIAWCNECSWPGNPCPAGTLYPEGTLKIHLREVANDLTNITYVVENRIIYLFSTFRPLICILWEQHSDFQNAALPVKMMFNSLAHRKPRMYNLWTLQGDAPQVKSWFIIPWTIDISPINYKP